MYTGPPTFRPDRPQTAALSIARVDLCGVLIDWGGVFTSPIPETVRSWAAADGIDWDSYVTVMRPWLFGEIADGINPVHALERGEWDPAEFERQLAARLVRGDGTPVPALGLLERMFAASHPVPAMYDATRTLRTAGLRTGLLSNSWGPGGYPRAEFPALFDAVVISAEVGMRKPEPRIFEFAAAQLGLTPAECVFIDDFEVNVKAATSCGMTAVLHESADLTVARLAELLPGLR